MTYGAKLMGSRRIAFVRIAFWAAILLSFLAAINPHPPQLPGAPSDKVQHIAAFLTLSALCFFAYRRTNPLYLGVGLSLFGALIELVQLIPALHRDGDVLDWVADTAATALMLIFLHWRGTGSRRRVAGKG